MDHLAILSRNPVPHVAFGWFNLAWPNIAFWIAAIAVFILFARARMPSIMEADARSRRKGVDQ